MTRSELAFADFMDDTARAYAKSGSFRAALHSELPGAPVTVGGICPPSHRHGETGTCYGAHKCRCDPCRDVEAKRQKQARMRRAIAAWGRTNERKVA